MEFLRYFFASAAKLSRKCVEYGAQKHSDRPVVNEKSQRKKRQKEQPERAAADVERHEQQADGNLTGKQHVGEDALREKHAQRAQHVIPQAERHPDQHAEGGLSGLNGNRKLHQPNSRERKLPPEAGFS